MKYLSRLASRSVAAVGVGLVALFWVVDAAIDQALFQPDHSFIDCLLHPEPMELRMRLLVALLFIALAILATTLLRHKENAEARLRHGSFRLEELALELAQKNESLRQEIGRREEIEQQLASLTVTDQLTGVFNRRKFDETLRTELRQEARYPRGLALIMLDIDHFKAVNDYHGHAVGDAVLKALARLVGASTRAADVFFRIGGEEFSIVTFAPDNRSLDIAAEKARRLVATHAFPKVGRLTISLGATRYLAGDDYDSLCKRADDALYQAKENGRNRVVVA